MTCVSHPVRRAAGNLRRESFAEIGGLQQRADLDLARAGHGLGAPFWAAFRLNPRYRSEKTNDRLTIDLRMSYKRRYGSRHIGRRENPSKFDVAVRDRHDTRPARSPHEGGGRLRRVDRHPGGELFPSVAVAGLSRPGASGCGIRGGPNLRNAATASKGGWLWK